MHSKRKWLFGRQRIELVELCLERGFTRRQAAAWRRVRRSTVEHWVDRHRAAGDDRRRDGSWALDRLSTPHRQPGRASDEVHERVCEARRRTGWGPRLIASELGPAHATVSRCLQRRGLSRNAAGAAGSAVRAHPPHRWTSRHTRAPARGTAAAVRTQPPHRRYLPRARAGLLRRPRHHATAWIPPAHAQVQGQSRALPTGACPRTADG